jgi:hypothetical protein
MDGPLTPIDAIARYRAIDGGRQDLLELPWTCSSRPGTTREDLDGSVKAPLTDGPGQGSFRQEPSIAGGMFWLSRNRLLGS